MEICSKNNLSKMEQSKLLKLINVRTITINKAGAAVILSTKHYKL